MTNTDFPAPVQALSGQEHEVAGLAGAAALRDAIPGDPRQLARLFGRHIVSARDFDATLLLQVFRLAAEYELGMVMEGRPLAGKVMSTLFLEHARAPTRLSFQRAWLNLGGGYLGAEESINDLLSNRTALDEVAEICNNYGDLAVLRTPRADMMAEILEYLRIPVINAGNGPDENPTNGITDIYTLLKWRPDLIHGAPAGRRLVVGVVGNPAATRTIRSFLYVLSMFSSAVDSVVILDEMAQTFSEGQREALEEAGLRIETTQDAYPEATEFESIMDMISQFDVVYVHMPQARDIRRLTFQQAIAGLKPHAMVLNPEIQLQEFSDALNNSPHNAYFAQARGNVFVRMALMRAVMDEGLAA